MAGRRVLILGGTRDAGELAGRLRETGGIDVTSSLAGVTRNPRLPEGRIRRGGFGGAQGLAAYLRDEAIEAVIDATHPYAACISRNAAEAAAMASVPVLHLVRPAWDTVSGDIWHGVADAAEAAAWLNASSLPDGSAVLLTIGRSELCAFAPVRRLRLIARGIEEPGGEVQAMLDRLILDRGPFTLDGERCLMVDTGTACLVAKNSGGTASYPKIRAARDLGLPVVMIERPPAPSGPSVGTVSEAVSWVLNLA
jgi:precorrin-6A/cobalt-precorrin-6A reductase